MRGISYLEYYVETETGTKSAGSKTGLVKKLETSQEIRLMQTYLDKERVFCYSSSIIVGGAIETIIAYATLYNNESDPKKYIYAGIMALPGLLISGFFILDQYFADKVIKNKNGK